MTEAKRFASVFFCPSDTTRPDFFAMALYFAPLDVYNCPDAPPSRSASVHRHKTRNVVTSYTLISSDFQTHEKSPADTGHFDALRHRDRR